MQIMNVDRFIESPLNDFICSLPIKLFMTSMQLQVGATTCSHMSVIFLWITASTKWPIKIKIKLPDASDKAHSGFQYNQRTLSG